MVIYDGMWHLHLHLRTKSWSKVCLIYSSMAINSDVLPARHIVSVFVCESGTVCVCVCCFWCFYFLCQKSQRKAPPSTVSPRLACFHPRWSAACWLTKTGPELLSLWISGCSQGEEASPRWTSSHSPSFCFASSHTHTHTHTHSSSVSPLYISLSFSLPLCILSLLFLSAFNMYPSSLTQGFFSFQFDFNLIHQFHFQFDSSTSQHAGAPTQGSLNRSI